MYVVFVWLGENAIIPLWGQITRPATISLWPWVTAVVILLGLAIILFSITIYFWDKNKIIRQAVNQSNKMAELDDSLLRLLGRLKPTGNLRNQTQRILEDLLRDITKNLPEAIYRASILLPNSTKEYLQIRVHYNMSARSIDRTRFYIGQDKNRESERGVAGTTFLQQQLRVGHITREKDHCVCDLEDYIHFDTNRHYPAYYSFVNVPIIGVDPNSPQEDIATTCFGVVCFDSNEPKVFDSPEIQKLLLICGRRIAATLSIYMNFSSNAPSHNINDSIG